MPDVLLPCETTMNDGGSNKRDNNEQQSALSPLVTAQDRKRLILERRRKEREQKTREHDAQDNDDDSMWAASTASRSASGSLKRQRRDSSHLVPKNNENITPKAGGRSTLFGAVMQRTTFCSTNGASTPTKQSMSNFAAAASTPNSRVAWNNISTPSSSRSKSFLSANSPCGFALLKVLESVASPFRHKEDDDQETKEESPDKKIEEWQEAYLQQNAVGVVDWSIKRRLRLECHPASCLPNASDWQDALSYWQHPAMYPLPTFEGDNNEQSTREISATMLPSLPNISDMVRGRDALLHRLCRKDSSTWRERRNREWQEAFRSLYFKWIQQLGSLQQALETGEKVSPQSVAQTYFYAMAPGHTILFRIGLEIQADDKPQIVPLIVLSSTTLQMRSKLRSMGAKIVYYHDRSLEFEEAILERDMPKKVTEDETEAVHEELEALRRAQAHGENAGADVSITTKTKATTKSSGSVPPLCLAGQDDCAAFFEYYLNTLGDRCNTWRKGGYEDVPLLLSRKVGPFMHASVQSLVVSSRREVRESHHKAGTQDHHHAAIELRGPILPCAVEELICSSASRMMKDTVGKDGVSNGHVDDVGSHYFVAQVQSHNGEACPSIKSATTGTAGSWLLNEGSDIYERLSSHGDKPSGCEQGEVLSMIVWDIMRPNMIAYKTEPSLS